MVPKVKAERVPAWRVLVVRFSKEEGLLGVELGEGTKYVHLLLLRKDREPSRVVDWRRERRAR